MKATAVIRKADPVSADVSRPSGMSATIAKMGGATVEVDPALDPTSSNPVENKAIVEALALKADLEDIPTAVSELTNDAGYVNATQAANAAPVQSVNSKTGAVVLDASDVGAIPDTTTFALGYDPDCSVGLAEVGDAVTGEPNYIPSGDIQQTIEELKLMTGGTAKLTASFYNGTLTLGVSLTPTTATKNVATSAPVFNGNGVHFVIKENE